MKPGSVIIDVAVDQGGCVETSRPTTHSDPTYIIDEVVHYCVANMPGAVGRTSTFALCNATLELGDAIGKDGDRGGAERERSAPRIGQRPSWKSDECGGCRCLWYLHGIVEPRLVTRKRSRHARSSPWS